MPYCSVCNVDVFLKPLYRNIDSKGNATWRCEDHRDKPPDPEVKKIADLIHNNGMHRDLAGPSVKASKG